MAGPWGTGPYKLVEGASTPDKRSDRVVLEANLAYWDPSRFPRLQRIIFDNTVSQKEAVERVKTAEGRVDLDEQQPKHLNKCDDCLQVLAVFKTYVTDTRIEKAKV